MQFKGYWKLRIFLSYLGQQVKKKGQKIMIMYLFLMTVTFLELPITETEAYKGLPCFKLHTFF